MAVADPIARLVKELARLPGIGEKTAQRLAFHILEQGAEQAGALADAITGVVRDVRCCSVCQTLTDRDPCALCGDPRRDPRIICVVESVPDLVAVERTHEFKGRYHVLHGALSPLDGVGPSDLKIRELLLRLEREPADEVVVATNPDVEGEATALYLKKLLGPSGVKVTRLAQGLPMGGDLEYADQVTLARALAGRREL
ncbi:MAG TPA: recombination mediator RecR [Anaeromyxobacteraceae bacterium]|jgi:recombination protein RecR|nr:recombination mediator RecR [Anaeromyxobacteraceae bacterium]